jgi:hypothetical protein
MEKIPTLFERDWEGDPSRVTPMVAAGCGWVLEGEGVATRKYDGTCVMFDGERWWARREVKAGKEPPPGFRPMEHDHKTLKAVGWQPIEDSPFAKFWRQAVSVEGAEWEPGTYELVGPKVNGNPEGSLTHQLIGHAGAQQIENSDRSYEGIRLLLNGLNVEGIVYHHPDGRMAKIKKRDFGQRRG